jgi:hypothetical protein
MSRADGTRHGGFLRRFISVIVAVGNMLTFLAHILGPVAIIFGLRTEVMTGESYPHSKIMIFVAFSAAALLFLFLISLYKSFVAAGKWRYVLIFCLIFLMLVGLSDTIRGNIEYGLAYIVVRGYVSSAFFCAWIAFNFYYWFYLRSKTTVAQ